MSLQSYKLTDDVRCVHCGGGPVAGASRLIVLSQPGGETALHPHCALVFHLRLARDLAAYQDEEKCLPRWVRKE